MSRPMHPRVVAALHAAIGAVPGCAMTRRVKIPAQRLVGRDSFRVQVEGWSPTLHQTTMSWPVSVVTGAAADDQAVDALSQIERALVVQRSRAEAGMGLEEGKATATPLEISSMVKTEVDHLQVDASAFAMHMIEGGGHENNPSSLSIGRIGHLIQQLHYETTGHGCGVTLFGKDVRAAERTEGRIVAWMQGVRHPGKVGGSCDAMMMGATVLLDGVHLPEAVLPSLAGERLSRIVEIHPLLDRRVVKRAARRAKGGLSVVLEPRNVPLSAHRGITVGESLGILEQAVKTTDEEKRP